MEEREHRMDEFVGRLNAERLRESPQEWRERGRPSRLWFEATNLEAIDERGLRKKEFLQNYAVWKAREPNKSHSSGCKVTTTVVGTSMRYWPPNCQTLSPSTQSRDTHHCPNFRMPTVIDLVKASWSQWYSKYDLVNPFRVSKLVNSPRHEKSWRLWSHMTSVNWSTLFTRETKENKNLSSRSNYTCGGAGTWTVIGY